ncbi:hypothetical protein FRX31_016865 [Thalictrum thalictroides]|uniref:Glutamate-1-semialdehyde 2,1-aminomutase n=1 Tax=Thalictrum thalictroides TaxID=46969 RepID=A0A7J6W9D6_THATH|nr:hypothetical protein FRX31_016865 [Thalictrum thalictroides]
MGVLRLARAFNGRKKIIKFEGCYHGHADPLYFSSRLEGELQPLAYPTLQGFPSHPPIILLHLLTMIY